jgi:hypothetical protein
MFLPNNEKIWRNLPAIEQAKHPEAPIERLEQLAFGYPREVANNPLLPLLALEDPKRYLKLQQRIRLAPVYKSFNDMFDHSNRRTELLYVADCTERILWVYERRFPGDLRPHQMVEANKAYVSGRIRQEERLLVRKKARSAEEEAHELAGECIFEHPNDPSAGGGSRSPHRT